MIRILRFISASNLLILNYTVNFDRRTRYYKYETGDHTNKSP